MSNKLPLFVVVLYFSTFTNAFFSPFKLQEVEYPYGDVGEPLILTPLLEQNKVQEARTKAKVVLDGEAKNIESYAGYFTVNKEYNSNLFFWFFPSKNDYKRDPVILWLQGGPGGPSLYGLLMENGPIMLNENETLGLRKHSWNNNHSMLYIDNPVGVGFSFTKEDRGYARNETQVGNELYIALQQFFMLFSELDKNEFFITGESYAGKYIPALAYTIHNKNLQASKKINLIGVAIGDGYIDPFYQVEYAAYLFELGLIDLNDKSILEGYQQTVKEHIVKERYVEAEEANDALLDFVQHATGSVSLYNYLQISAGVDESQVKGFVNKPETRRAIHVGNTTFGNKKVSEYLEADMQKPITPWFVEVANNYRVMLYSGQLDIIVAYPLTLNLLEHVQFKFSDSYRKASRKVWYVEKDIAGYSKTAGNFTEVLVRDAGHMVPIDQPKWAEDLMKRFVTNQFL